MAMIAITGYRSLVFEVTDLTVVGLEDMGFTDEDIREGDTAHISHISIEDDAPTLYYWYTQENGQDEPKEPVNESGNAPEGHPIFPGGERMIRGTRNLRRFRVVAGTGSARIAITVGTFGRTPVT